MIELLVDQLIDLNIAIEVVDREKLCIHSDIDKIPGHILSEITLRKKELVDYLIARRNGTGFGKIPEAGLQTDYILSSSQKRIWILSQFEEVNTAYNIPGLYLFEEGLDLAALEHAFNMLIRRHESLRTVFRENEHGEVRQFILPAEAGFRVEYQDLRQTGVGEEKIQTMIWSEFTRPFDLAYGPLLRAKLFHMSDQWILAYTLHHIISDGWSMAVLIKELSVFYQAVIRGEEHGLSPLRIQYKDYACWQQEQIAGDMFQIHRSYWLKQLEGELPVLALPGDKPRPRLKTYKGGVVRRSMDLSLLKRVRSLCQDQGATMFMGLLAAINLLLHRYTGQNDIIIGTPIAGREHADLEGQIGMYVNTLALRMRIKKDSSFWELLSEIRTMTLDGYEHQGYPFDILVEQLDLPRDMSRTPLFDVMIIYNNNGVYQQDKGSPARPLSGKDDRFREDSSLSKFDLTFSFTESGEELYMSLEYSEDIFTRASATRMTGHLEQLLDIVSASPLSPIGDLDYLTRHEKTQLIEAFNRNEAEYGCDKTIVGLFRDQADKKTDAIALVCEDVIFTYKELDEQSDRLSNYLHHIYKVRKGELVAIKLERDPWLLVSILAVLKCGAAYIPVDPKYPADRIAYMIADSRCIVVLDEEELIKFRTGVASSNQACPIDLGPEDLAYVIYTSGSTGRPKGVMITHGSVTNHFAGLASRLPALSDECMLAVTSASFDISVIELLWTLCYGVQVVIHARDVSAGGLNRYIPSAGVEEPIKTFHRPITMMQATPSYMKLLSDDPESISFLQSLRILLIGGESLPGALLSRIQEFCGAEVYNMYGPTETTIYSCMHKFRKGEERVLIGTPMVNTQVYILDDNRQMLPLGVSGEIYIGGKGVARGYLNRLDLTQENFLPDTFSGKGRIYKTGDIGKWLPDGTLEVFGRKDNQVKIRGYRIETAEVESALQKYPGVESAIVIDRADDQGDKELVAYITGRSVIDSSNIRAYLGSVLPGFMIPGHFIQLPELPLTPNGKADRKKMATLPIVSKDINKASAPPATEIERALAQVWERILNKEGIGIHDDYFELGGDSLKAMKIIKGIADETGRRVPLKVLFMERNIGRIAAYIQGQGVSKERNLPAPLLRTHDTLCDASYNQLSYFSEWNKEGDHIVVSAYEFSAMDEDVFTLAVNKLIERHEILRTVFIQNGSGIKQKILRAKDCCWKMDDPAAPASYDSIDTVIRNEGRRKFDLYKGPLFHIQLCGQQDNRCFMVVAMHHVITDGYSGGVLKKELAELYERILRGQAADLEPLPFQYKDYSRWQRQFSGSVEGIQHKDYWLHKLSGFQQRVKFPLCVTGDEQEEAGTIGIPGVIEGELYEKMEGFAKANGLTTPALLLGVLTILINQVSGQMDITLLTSVSGRDSQYFGDLDVSGLIGHFSNFILVRNRIGIDKPLIEYLRAVQDNFIDDLGHDAYPFDKLMRELPDVDKPGFLDAAVFYNYHNYSYKKQSPYPYGEVPSEQKREGETPLQFSLGLSVTEFRNCLALQFIFDSRIFDRSHRIRIKDLLFSNLRDVTGSSGMATGELANCTKYKPELYGKE